MASLNSINCNCWGNVIPTEILINIFTRLSPKSLIKCREVCIKWKFIVDDFIFNDRLWHKHYKTNFKIVYKSAKLNPRRGVTWFQIYRSLSLWSKLLDSRERRNELITAPTIDQEIKGFRILKEGVIAVHTQGSIIYYDLATLQKSHKEPITGEYNNYAENNYAIVTSSYQQLLFIVRKVKNNSKSKTQLTFSDIRTFILLNQYVYFANLNNEIYVCNLHDDDMETTFIAKVDEEILCFGFSGSVHVLTVQRVIYTIKNKHLVSSSSFNVKSNLLHYLNTYSMLDSLNWRIYLNWAYILTQKVPVDHNGKPLQDIIVIHSYGDVFFVGSNWGVLSVYYAPYTLGELDLFNLQPVKQYNLKNSNESSLTICPILQIDVQEVEDGHNIIVAMPKKIVVLNIIHDFKLTVN